MVSWFKGEFGKCEEDEASTLGVSPEAVLDKQLNDIPAGSTGLLVQPYWHPRENDPLSKGAMIGFSGQHTRKHVYRAIIEGIAYELRRLGELMVKRSGNAMTELRVGGGGSQSDEIMQITADIFGLPAMRMHTSNLAALGAAIDTAVALGIHRSFPEGVERMVRIKKAFQPADENAKIYDRLFREVYVRMYPALSPLHHRIAEIANYPKTR
jgi:sugar (pentulose or hexulose) kinase